MFLCCMAIENAVAATIPDPQKQKYFDRICIYVGLGCFLVIHIVAVVFVITKVRILFLILIPEGQSSNGKGVGMFTVPLIGVDCRFGYHIECSLIGRERR